MAEGSIAMSRAQTRAKNMSRLLNNLGNNGALSLRAMQMQMPRVVGVRWSHNGTGLRIGKDWLKGATGTEYAEWPACTRVRIEGQGAVTATLVFYYQGYGERIVRARIKTEGNAVISFPVPLPDGWSYPDAAGRLTNMSRQGEFS